jgi:hypothetical protein
MERGDRLRRTGVGLVLAAVLAVGAQATAAPTFVLKRVASQSTSIPGFLGLLPYFKEFNVPAVDDGTVAFRANGFLDFNGILTWDSAGLTIVADHTTAMPGFGSTKFKFFGLPAIRGGKIAFVGGSSLDFFGGKMGIYKTPVAGGALTAVADSNTTIPGSSLKFNYFEYANPGLDQGKVAFAAGNLTLGNPPTFNESGIYTDVFGSLTTVADTSTALPGSTSTFEQLSFAQLEGTQIGFSGTGLSASREGIYATSLGIMTVVDTLTPFPGLSMNTFDGFSGYSFSGGWAAFAGTGPGLYEFGVFAATFAGTSLTTLVTRNTPVPGYPGAEFDEVDEVSLDAGYVAFTAKDTKVFDSLYRLDIAKNDLQRIVRTGDTLDGGKVSEVFLGSDGLDGPDVAFHVRFSGPNEGVYLASEGGSILVGDIPAGVAQIAPLPCLLCPRLNFADLLVFGLALGDEGFGVDQAVWVEGPPARYVDYRAEGSRFASVTPPVGVDEDGRFDLWLPDPASGRLMDSGIELMEGEPYYFVTQPDVIGLLGNEGVVRFRIGGIDLLPGAPGDDILVEPSFPAAVTFTDIHTLVEVGVAPMLEPELDVRPRNDRNHIKASSRAKVPVALLGSESFDAETVDVATLLFGPEGAQPTGRRPSKLKDVNRDGFDDLLLKFRANETGLGEDDGVACLEGATDAGQAFMACDAVEVKGADSLPRWWFWFAWWLSALGIV